MVMAPRCTGAICCIQLAGFFAPKLAPKDQSHFSKQATETTTDDDDYKNILSPTRFEGKSMIRSKNRIGVRVALVNTMGFI